MVDIIKTCHGCWQMRKKITKVLDFDGRKYFCTEVCAKTWISNVESTMLKRHPAFKRDVDDICGHLRKSIKDVAENSGRFVG